MLNSCIIIQDWNHTAPILSDIIYVKEEYRTALENVLEPYLSYYVVNNLQEGLQAVHLLDENKKGKANFFLLDKIQNHDFKDFTDSEEIRKLINLKEPFLR